MRVDSPRALLPLVVLVGAAAAWYASRLEPPQFVSDDGAITLRYAERIAQGRGFTYNDGERINGASCTLTTLVLAGLLRAGLSAGGAVLVLGAACFAGTMMLLFATFARHWSLFAAGFALAAYMATDFLFAYQFDALEPSLVMLLAAALFHALHTRNGIYQGVVLGLLVACKLDAALAAIAFALAWVIAERAFPMRATLAACAAFLPVCIVLLASFGTILPQSALTKVLDDAGHERLPFDRAWISRDLMLMLPLMFVPALLAFVGGGTPVQRLVRNVMGTWCLLHVLAYSFIDMGAPYPWYASTPAFLILILAAMTAHRVFEAREQGSWRGARWLGVVLMLAVFFVHGVPAIVDRLEQRDARGRLTISAAGDVGRLAAGAWLRKHTSGSELLCSGYGLPAFEYKGPVYDLALLNSRFDADVLARAQYLVRGPFGGGDRLPAQVEERFGLVASFRYGEHAEQYALYAAPESEAARSGACHLRVDLASTAPLDALTGEPLDPARIIVRRDDLFARVPTAALFTVRSSCVPGLAFIPEVRSAPGRDDAVRVRVHVNDVELDSAVLHAGAGSAGRVVLAMPPSADGEYRIVFSAESLAPAAEGLWVRWGGLEAWAGPGLEPADFTLLCAPWARRIASTERGGSN